MPQAPVSVTVLQAGAQKGIQIDCNSVLPKHCVRDTFRVQFPDPWGCDGGGDESLQRPRIAGKIARIKVTRIPVEQDLAKIEQRGLNHEISENRGMYES